MKEDKLVMDCQLVRPEEYIESLYNYVQSEVYSLFQEGELIKLKNFESYSKLDLLSIIASLNNQPNLLNLGYHPEIELTWGVMTVYQKMSHFIVWETKMLVSDGQLYSMCCSEENCSKPVTVLVACGVRDDLVITGDLFEVKTADKELTMEDGLREFSGELKFLRKKVTLLSRKLVSEAMRDYDIFKLLKGTIDFRTSASQIPRLVEKTVIEKEIKSIGFEGTRDEFKKAHPEYEKAVNTFKMHLTYDKEYLDIKKTNIIRELLRWDYNLSEEENIASVKNGSRKLNNPFTELVYNMSDLLNFRASTLLVTLPELIYLFKKVEVEEYDNLVSKLRSYYNELKSFIGDRSFGEPNVTGYVKLLAYYLDCKELPVELKEYDGELINIIERNLESLGSIDGVLDYLNLVPSELFITGYDLHIHVKRG